MNKLVILVIAVMALAVGVFVAIGYAADGQARVETARGNAEAAIVRANGQAAIDRAYAARISADAAVREMQGFSLTVITLVLGATPFLIVLAVSVVGLAVVSVPLAAVINRPRVVLQPPQIIERQVLYLPRPDQSRHEVWQQIQDGNIEVVRSRRNG